MRKVDLRAVKRNGDRAILEELIKRGDALEGPHHAILFFSRTTHDERSAKLVLNLLSQRLQSLGWTISGADATGVTAECHCPVDPESVNAMSDTMDMLAAELGVEYDGWECEVISGERR